MEYYGIPLGTHVAMMHGEPLQQRPQQSSELQEALTPECV
jgi:hypothetical protein